jgi:hypothetical protein
MNVEIGTETPIFLFWEFLFQIFGILSLECKSITHAQAQHFVAIKAPLELTSPPPRMQYISCLSPRTTVQVQNFVAIKAPSQPLPPPPPPPPPMP